MNIYFSVEGNGRKPVKAHDNDAGFDLYVPKDITLKKGVMTKINMNIRMYIPRGFVAFIFPRSSMSVCDIHVPTGVIDSEYTGEISVCIKSQEDLEVGAGTKIAQLVILPIPQGINLIEGDVKNFNSERGAGGFGSTGK